VEARHRTLLLPDPEVLAMQLARLPRRELAFADFAVDAEILVAKARVHLCTARVRVLPEGLGRSAGGRQAKRREREGDEGEFAGAGHGMPPPRYGAPEWCSELGEVG